MGRIVKYPRNPISSSRSEEVRSGIKPLTSEERAKYDEWHAQVSAARSKAAKIGAHKSWETRKSKEGW